MCICVHVWEKGGVGDEGDGGEVEKEGESRCIRLKRYNNCTGCQADLFRVYTTAATGPK